MNQTDMFIRIVEAGTTPMAPNKDGLFNANQVAVLADKRNCLIEKAGEYGIDIKFPVGDGKWTSKTITATDKELWHPINIFRSCRESAGKPHYDGRTKAKLKNPGNLNEALIAEILGADGVKPYLSRHAQKSIDGEVFGEPGDWTWTMLHVITARKGGHGPTQEYRRALRSLDDAGLIRLQLGTRMGFGTATFEWMPLAYLAAPEKPKMPSVDSDYLCDIMALS